MPKSVVGWSVSRKILRGAVTSHISGWHTTLQQLRTQTYNVAKLTKHQGHMLHKGSSDQKKSERWLSCIFINNSTGKTLFNKCATSSTVCKWRLMISTTVCREKLGVHCWSEGYPRQRCRLNICCYIGWIDKYSICQFNQYNMFLLIVLCLRNHPQICGIGWQLLVLQMWPHKWCNLFYLQVIKSMMAKRQD